MMIAIKDGGFYSAVACVDNQHIWRWDSSLCEICGSDCLPCAVVARFVPKPNPTFIQRLFDPIDVVWEFARWVETTESK